MNQSLIVSVFNSIPLWIMIVPIALCSVLLLGAIIERLFFYKRIDIDYRLLLLNVGESIEKRKYDEAQVLCQNYSGPIVNMINLFINRARVTENKELLINDLAERTTHTIERFTGMVSTIATVSPMLGLLGTVTGMMKSFNNLASKGPAARDLLAQGITEALITTALGLLVAIPAIIFYNYMVSKTIYFGREVEYIANNLESLN